MRKLLPYRALCLLPMLILLAACTTTTVATLKPAAVELPAEVPPPLDRRQLRVSIAATGDIMPGTDYPQNRLPDDDGIGFYSGVSNELQRADVAFGNFEGSLLDGGEPEKTCKNPKACYLFRSPSRYAQYLADAGFDAISLANNHALDFGEAGRDASMAALQSVGIQHSGRDGDIAIWTHQDTRYAMMAFSPTRGSHDLIDYQKYLPVIAGLAANNDIVIISFHGGAEGQEGVERLAFGMEFAYGERRGDVVAFAHDVVDAGADLVVGHGPHIPRALEVYKDRVIAYSLGNFATYYGISVSGAKGYAPMLYVTLDGEGKLVDGKISSYIQVRPGGPLSDSRQRAWNMIKALTLLDFPDSGLLLGSDGSFYSSTAPQKEDLKP